MKEKLNLSEVAQTALIRVMQAAVANSQQCWLNPNCKRAPSTILQILAERRDFYLTPCIRCAITQFAEAHGQERDRDALVEVYQTLFKTDDDTASKILGRLN
jgi:hypothetical protein